MRYARVNFQIYPCILFIILGIMDAIGNRFRLYAVQTSYLNSLCTGQLYSIHIYVENWKCDQFEMLAYMSYGKVKLSL